MSLMQFLRGSAGALLGAVLGSWLVGVMLRWGFYGMALPGALIGAGAGLLSGGRSTALGASSAVLALLVSVLTEWRYMPFAINESLGFFLRNLHQLPAGHWVMITIGVVLAFLWGRGGRVAGAS